MTNNVLFTTFLAVLFACNVESQYRVGGACDVGDHEDNLGMYKPHPTDCGKYLQCLHGIFGERPCADGLHWNAEEGACDWPVLAKCEEFDTAQRDVVGGPCNVGDHEDNLGMYRPHPSDCEKYIQCLHGIFGERSCSPGLHWNAEEEACDWPVKAKCAQASTQNFEPLYPVPPIQKV